MGSKLFKLASLTFVCLFLLISQSNAQVAYDEKHIEVSLRMIGHQILLNSGDSTSRVLPIIKTKDQYRIQFESEFAFYPGELVPTINRVVTNTRLANRYIVEVEKCETGAVVYSYEIDELEQTDIIPCKSRIQPKSCYSLLFTLMEPKATWYTSYSAPLSGSNTEKSRINYTVIGMMFSLIIGMGVGFIFWKRRKNLEIDPNLISLGEYQFDKRNTELLIDHQKIELSSKEADLLLLLYKAVNTTVEREVILKMVWGDKGDYVGRTLDVFISKLRKKLEADSRVKIVNIRGVGYKLVVDV